MENPMRSMRWQFSKLVWKFFPIQKGKYINSKPVWNFFLCVSITPHDIRLFFYLSSIFAGKCSLSLSLSLCDLTLTHWLAFEKKETEALVSGNWERKAKIHLLVLSNVIMTRLAAMILPSTQDTLGGQGSGVRQAGNNNNNWESKCQWLEQGKWSWQRAGYWLCWEREREFRKSSRRQRSSSSR